MCLAGDNFDFFKKKKKSFLHHHNIGQWSCLSDGKQHCKVVSTKTRVGFLRFTILLHQKIKTKNRHVNINKTVMTKSR